MPKKPTEKGASLPDLKTRFGWLPGANYVDPQIYTQLDPTARKPVPDYGAQDTPGPQAQPDAPPPVKVQPPPGGGGGGGGGGVYVPPPVTPPPIRQPPKLPPPRIGSGSEHLPPPVTLPPGPTITIGPVGGGGGGGGGGTGSGSEFVPPPLAPPIGSGQSWTPPINRNTPPLPPGPTISIGPTGGGGGGGGPTGSGSEFVPPPLAPPIGSGQSWTPPIKRTTPPLPPGPTISTGPIGTGSSGGGEPGGGGGGGDGGTGGSAGVIDGGSGGFIEPPPPPPPPPPPGRGGTGTDQTIDWGPDGGKTFVGGVGFGRPYGYARGGIIMKPRIGRVGERGPEAIMKLGPRMPGGWEVPMRPGKLPYESMRYKRRSEIV